MRKRLLASIMAMVLLPSLFPVSALAVERDKGSETPVACAVTEGCTLQAGHKCECVLPDEPETTEDDPAPADNVMSGNCGLYDYINKEYTDTVKWALTANDEDGYTLTIFGNGPMGNAYITEDNVSSGEPEWHYSREKITRVVIQDGVTSVGAKSFKNYTNLKTVVLPASITKIGQDSFYGSGITSITLPANLTTIEPQAFYKCSSLNGTISVPVGVFSIPSYTFAATSISSIEFNGAVTEIGVNAFMECSSLTSITLPDTVTTIAPGAFSNCIQLESFVFPENPQFTKISKETFKGCTKLEEVLIPSSVTEIAESAFQGCTNLKRVVLSNNLNTIGSMAFKDASLMEGVYIPASVSSIPENNQIFKGMANNSVIYLGSSDLISLMLQSKANPTSTSNGFDSEKTSLAVTDGGTFAADTKFESGKLATPIKEGSIFDGWYKNEGCTGTAVTTSTAGETYYAKWIELKSDAISMEYGSTQTLPTIEGVTLSNWQSSDSTIVSIEDDQLKANKVGKTTITATARTEAGVTGTLTVNVEVTPMRIIYGKADTTQNDGGIGRPYITYALNEDGTAPKFSDLLGFYPVKKGSQNGTYEADIAKDKIDLKPGMGDDGDVYYKYQNEGGGASGNIIETGTLPTHPTTDAEGNPHSIRVELKLKNPNYRFCTVGTNWQPSDTIILYVTCYEEGMNEVDLYLEGDDKPLETFEGDRVYEYTGQGIVPTARNLTTLYTKGTSTDHSITSFTAHFHAVQEGTAFSGTHLYNQTNSHLTADALKAIAPTELGVYSFVINGYSKDTKTYCYASRRYSIVMGNPKGEPTFDKVSSGVELSTITLSGSMKNAAGIEVAGTFSWDDGDQTLERGKSYAWTFTPDDTDHYNKATGTAVVWPSSSGGGFSSGRFTVSVDSGKNGSVTVSPKRAEKGDTVTITVKPNEGYELDKLVVTGKNGDEIKLTNEGGGKYTFKMPASSVEIEASFAKIEAEPKLPFADVSSGDWYYDAVVYVYKNGLMDGTGPAAFAPTTVLTRSMAAQVLWNLADSPAVPGTAGFTDVPSDAWYAGAVNWSASRGIVTGYSTGAFGPEDAVTREQLAAMLYRYAGTPEPTGSLDGFNDKDAVSDYAADALCWAVDEGLLTGKGGGWLDPAGTATRAEMAAILMRFTESHN